MSLLTFRKQDSVQLPSFGRRLHLSMNKTLGTVIFQLTTNASRKIKKTTNTEVSKIDSKKRHAVFNNFKETDLRLFIKKKKNNNNNSKKYEKGWLRQINVFSWDKLSSRQ